MDWINCKIIGDKKGRWVLKNIVILILLAVVAAGGSVRAEERAAQKEHVAVGEVTEENNTLHRSLVGVVTSPSIVNLTSRVSAEIENVGFKEGGKVEKGQVLYQLDQIKYDAAVKSSEAAIKELEAKLVYAESTYKRYQNLFNKKISTKDELDSALSTLNSYKAELEAEKANLILAKKDLKNTTIVATIDGQIGITNFTQGNYVTTSSGTLATIVQLDPVRVRFTISNRDFLSLFSSELDMRSRASVKIRLADGKEYDSSGTIEFINNLANESTDTLQVYALFDNPEKKLIPGSIVTVELFKTADQKEAAVQPSAVMHDVNGAYVYVVDDASKVERREVTLGTDTASLQFVSKGLKAGEKVIVDGMHKVLPGSEVIPVYVNN